MGINFTAVKKVLKSAESVWVQYTENGKFVEVLDGHFIARMTAKQYKDEGFVKALGTGLPSDKTTALVRKGKKSDFEIAGRIKTEAMTQIEKNSSPAKPTKVHYELPNGAIARVFKSENGQVSFLNTCYSDIIKDCYSLMSSEKYDGAILYIQDSEIMAMLLPVRGKVEDILGELKTEPKSEVVEDEPLTAPTEEAEEEVEDELDEIPEGEDNLDWNDERVIERAKAINIENGEPELNECEEDELDDISNLEEVKAVEGEEPPTVIDGWTVPSDIFIEVTPNGTMWAIGKTKPEKENLKRLGFHYAPKAERAKKAGYPRSAWYRKAEVAAAD